MPSAVDAQPLRPEQLQTIKEHQYSCRGSSLFEKYFQIFWCSLVPYIPTWIAPNTLTLSGLVLNAVSVLVLLHYSPDLQSEVCLNYSTSCWTRFRHGLSSLAHFASLFIRHLMLLMESRRDAPILLLHSESCSIMAVTQLQQVCVFPNHNLFALVFVPLSLCVAVGIGNHPVIVFCQFFIFMALFYLAHWQCYITGFLEFGLYVPLFRIIYCS